jgi:predicted MPP superfamily phosphohydrolase
MFLGRIASWLVVSPIVTVFIAVSSTIQLAVLISIGVLLPVDAARGLARVARFVRGRFAKETPAAPALATPAPVESSPEPVAAAPELAVPRRAFLTQAAAGSAFLIGTSSSLYGALAGRHDYAIEEVPVKLPGLARALDGFTIVQLSDLHIGQFTGDPELTAALDLVKRARPDLIVLTGDLLDNDPRLAPRLGRFVRELAPLARAGVAAIPGNHDFFAGVDPTMSAIEAAGGRTLRNRGERVGDAGAGFALLGVDDVWATRMGGGPDVTHAITSLPRIAGRVAPARDLPRVLLCHNPSYFEFAAGQVDLQLSGHTHGGQVNLFVRPADLVLPHGWVAGRYTRSGSELYVNRGFGTVGPPARIGAPPEVSRIVLVAS